MSSFIELKKLTQFFEYNFDIKDDMDEKTQISTNWCLLRGRSISESLVVKISENKNAEIERPSIDDIVSFEQSIHLQQPQHNEENDNLNAEKREDCEIIFKINLSYKSNFLTLVTDCQTLEMFINCHKEYYNTYIGEFLDDFDGMRVYRFDIEICHNISYFVIKFIPRVPEIWIYGMQINLSNNNQIAGATSPIHHINIENVKSLLTNSNHKLTPKAEQCKSFVENFLQGSAIKQFSNLECKNGFKNWPTDLENFKIFLNSKNFPSSSTILNSDITDVKKLSLNGNNENDNSKNIDELKEYIDKSVLAMENRINLQLQALENRQNEKLDKIIEILTSQNN